MMHGDENLRFSCKINGISPTACKYTFFNRLLKQYCFIVGGCKSVEICVNLCWLENLTFWLSALKSANRLLFPFVQYHLF